MNFTSDIIHGSPNFHTTISKQSDGTFVAKVDIVGIEPAQAPTESQAILKLRTNVENWFGRGGK